MSEWFTIEVQGVFSASHQLRLEDGSLEPLHGHDWHVELTLRAQRLDALETVMDFHQLQESLRGVLAGYQHRHLNDVAPFDAAVNPSAEQVARTIGLALWPGLPGQIEGLSVRVSEAPGCHAAWHRYP